MALCTYVRSLSFTFLPFPSHCTHVDVDLNFLLHFICPISLLSLSRFLEGPKCSSPFLFSNSTLTTFQRVWQESLRNILLVCRLLVAQGCATKYTTPKKSFVLLMAFPILHSGELGGDKKTKDGESRSGRKREKGMGPKGKGGNGKKRPYFWVQLQRGKWEKGKTAEREGGAKFCRRLWLPHISKTLPFSLSLAIPLYSNPHKALLARQGSKKGMWLCPYPFPPPPQQRSQL